MKAEDVFSPGEFPEHTFVERDGKKIQKTLSDALRIPGQIISISGPSKAGKTVLLEYVAGKDNVISIPGSKISTPQDVWKLTANWFRAPSETSTTNSISGEGSLRTEASAEGGIPLLFRGRGGGSASGKLGASRATTSKFELDPMAQVVEEIGGSDFVLFLDDFHYVARDVQSIVAQQLKTVVRDRVKVCLASVPYRSDDAVRANPELRGRYQPIDIGYWNNADLGKIPRKGFPLLNVSLRETDLARFASESVGSPQVMQAICLRTCHVLGVYESGPPRVFELLPAQLREIYGRVASSTDYSRLLAKLKSGPKERGTPRKKFRLRSGGEGDVYTVLIEALAKNPPRLEFRYPELRTRVEQSCDGEAPSGSSLSSACGHMDSLCKEAIPDARIVEWDPADNVLAVHDPHFLFYIRWYQQS